MRYFAPLLVFILLFSSCKSSKSRIVTTKREAAKTSEVSTASPSEYKLANAVINHALVYEGVRYKYGGTTERGMDCSGLIYVAFKKENILLPRISRDMASEGKPLKKSEVKEGDLVFFRTSKRKNKINHVGLVTKRKKGEIFFIHSTTSKGVIQSSLDETYWNKAYVSARRIL
ncbi:MAG: C40 family peptidase [Bacteroidia bacterium]|nr:C40 family peptidase [Bacteroidia bacterium]MBT8268930.1 C40 family peptidase [Bacteroidia bacterium]NNF81330.1 C40 family peptidase [Flavobacteriaceae bacterium]NNK68995.1 C40 family peptidase [Flavobacteriaceae bacterium]NNL81438.1 C40 family peptidase [Flavobacteriaceae bacterium]